MIRGMRQYRAVTANAFMVTLSDPVYLILTCSILVGLAFFGTLPTFTFGQEIRFIRDQALAFVFIGGCLIALLGSLSTVVRDLRLGATAVLMSRPISGFGVMVGKLTGLIGALMVYQVTAGVAALWMTRIAGRGGQSQVLDRFALTVYLGAIAVSLIGVAVRHYFMGGWYVWHASLVLPVVFVTAFVVASFFDNPTAVQHWGMHVDWPTAIGIGFLFLAQLTFLGIVLVLAVSMEMPLVLGCGVGLFLFGMVSQYIVVNAFGSGWLRSMFSAVLPNWQAFWVSDLLADKKKLTAPIVLGYAAHGVIHVFLYLWFTLVTATWLFNKREIAGSGNLQED
jgi:hypothetical protein